MSNGLCTANAGSAEPFRRHHWILFLVAFAWFLGPNAAIVMGQTYVNNIGTPTFTTKLPVENGFINAANGNLHLEIPFGSWAQRAGRQVTAKLTYDSAIWVNSGTYWSPTNVPGSLGGWQFVDLSNPGSVNYDYSYNDCWYDYNGEQVDDGHVNEKYWGEFYWTGPDGTQHSFNINTWEYLADQRCIDYNDGVSSGSAYADDGSGYYMVVTSYDYVSQVYGPNGALVYDAGSGNVADSNGNLYGAGGDSLGRTLVYTTTGTNSITYHVLNSQGGYSSYTVTTGAVNAHTAFGSGEWNSSFSAIQSIALPDGTSYSFGYDTSTSSGHYGQLTSMTLPTGGTIYYTYNKNTDAFGNSYSWISSRTTPDSGSSSWTYTLATVNSCSSGQVECSQTLTVAKPPISGFDADTTVYKFNLNGGAWNTEVHRYTGLASSGTLLSTVTKCYNYVTVTNGQCTYAVTTSDPAVDVFPTASTTTLPVPGGSGTVSATIEYTWDSYGNMTEMDEWNFGSAASGSADRKTSITYLSGSAYTSVGIVDKATSVTVKNTSGTTIAQTNYCYDYAGGCGGSGFANVSSVTYHDPNFGTSYTVRGDLTQIQQSISGTSNYLTTSMTYDITGQVTSSTDSNGNTTSYSYTDHYYDDNGTASPGAHSTSTGTNGFVTTTTAALSSGSSTATYYYGTGQMASVTDANSNTTHFSFDDLMNRSTNTWLPNGGWTASAYSSGETQIDTGTGITNTSPSATCAGSGYCRHDQSLLDSSGRAVDSNLVNDPNGETTVATVYDVDGRVKTVSNPYRSTSDPTYGLETPAYDGLDRIITATHADSDVAHIYYGAAVSSGGGLTSQSCSGYGVGYPVLTADEVGRKRETWTDGFGRVIETDEPDSSGSLSGTYALHTCYSYDLNNNRAGVLASNGTQTRSYSYDLLSRLTAQTDPETGTTYFCYGTGTSCNGTSSTTLCSGDQNAVCLRTDAKGITTTYAYDALNRLTSKSYNDSSPTTPSVTYSYDQTSYNGLTITNGKGRRTGMSDGSGQTAWSYDSVGNILTEERTINSATNTILYTYNLDGSVATVQYPGGRTVTYTTGNAQRPTAAADNAHSINYAGASSSLATYAPTGDPTSIVYGYVSGGGITETRTYNNRLQLTGIQAVAAATSTTVLNLSYSYAQSSHDNGNIATQTNSVDTGRTQTYTYDTLNRLLTAQAAATSGTDCWGQSYGNTTNLATDALANLFYTTSTNCTNPQPRYTPDAHNHFGDTGFTYDSDGDMTADTVNSYTYDAESRIRSATVGGTYYCYLYDGDGLRVEKATASSTSCSSPTANVLYWRNIAGNTIAETDGSGSTSSSNTAYNEYIFFAGRRIAQSNPHAGTVNYYFVDHLGNTRIMTTAGGTVCFDSEYYPYGLEMNHTSTCSTNYKFTGYERDSETGLDYAFARYYNSRLGRFMSGDPLGSSADASDPQTLNRYAYVRNNPVNLIDPSGMSSDCGDDCGPPPHFAEWCNNAETSESEIFDMETIIFCNNMYMNIFGTNGTEGGGGGSVSPAPPPQTLRLIVSADCLDGNGRWIDYQLVDITGAPLTESYSITEHVVDATTGQFVQQTTGPSGNQFSDWQAPAIGIIGLTQFKTSQQFTVGTNGPTIPVRENGKDYATLGIFRKAVAGPNPEILINGKAAPNTAAPGSKCPSDSVGK